MRVRATATALAHLPLRLRRRRASRAARGGGARRRGRPARGRADLRGGAGGRAPPRRLRRRGRGHLPRNGTDRRSSPRPGNCSPATTGSPRYRRTQRQKPTFVIPNGCVLRLPAVPRAARSRLGFPSAWLSCGRVLASCRAVDRSVSRLAFLVTCSRVPLTAVIAGHPGAWPPKPGRFTRYAPICRCRGPAGFMIAGHRRRIGNVSKLGDLGACRGWLTWLLGGCRLRRGG